jgi:hypothetical protein
MNYSNTKQKILTNQNQTIMKKWKFLFAALMMSVAVFVSSCGDDKDETDPGPSLTLKGGTGYTSVDANLLIGSTIKVGVVGGKSSVSGNKLTRFRFIYTANNVPTTLLDSTLNADSFNWETDIEFTGVGSGRLSFELTDKGGMKTEKGFNVTVEGLQVNKYLNVELGSYNENLVGSFFDATLGQVYTVPLTFNDPLNRKKVDFVFFKGPTNGNAFASPDNADLNTITALKVNLWDANQKNQTRFNKTAITPAQFDAIGDYYEFPTFNVNNQTNIMSENFQQMTVGSVFLFKTQAGKRGLVKVIDLYSRGDRAKISVIVEK